VDREQKEKVCSFGYLAELKIEHLAIVALATVKFDYLFSSALNPSRSRSKIVAKLGRGRVSWLYECRDSQSARKPIHRTHKLDARINLPPINLRSQELDLSALIGLVDINVPGAWPSVGAIAPSIAAPFQGVLEFEWRLFGPDTNGLAASPFKQDCEGGSVQLGNIGCQNFHQSPAIVDSAMRLVEQAYASQEISKA
jgi:hypothetical protein